MKPYDYQHYSSIRLQAVIGCLCTTGLTLGSIATTVAARVSDRTSPIIPYALLAGLAATVPARTGLKVIDDTQRLLNDYEDISGQVRTNQVFTQMSLEPAKKEPEYNWQRAKYSMESISILGDPERALLLAQWLATGHVVYINTSIQPFQCSQQILVRADGETGLLLPEILDYKAISTYEGLIDSLGKYKGSYMTLVLINPPQIPINNPNLRYISIGKDLGYGIKIYLGSDATAKHPRAKFQDYPCLVDSSGEQQVARWVL